MPNVLTDPPFATDPPVKMNVDAKILGLVIGIIAVIFAVFGLIGLIAVFGACTIAGVTISGCGFPILWLLGSIVVLAAEIAAAVGGFRMYQLNREGKNLVIYGLALGAVGALLFLVGQIIFYSGYAGLGGGYGGAIAYFIIYVIVYFVIYYLVVISRFPGDAPLAPTPGYPTPPPPPPPSAL